MYNDLINELSQNFIEYAAADNLMGTEITPRKNFIKNHSKEATYNV